MALTCRNVQHLLDAYVDEELSAGMTAEVQAHLLQCPECQRQVELVRAVGSVIAVDRPEPSLPPGFATRVVSALPRGFEPAAPIPLILTRRQRRRQFFERFVSASAPAAAAIILVTALIWPGSQSAVAPGAGRVVLGEKDYAPVDVLAVRSLVDPTMKTFANTSRAADHLQGLYRISVNDARAQSAGKPARDEGTSYSNALLMELLRPFSEMTAPLPPDDQRSTTDDVVRF